MTAEYTPTDEDRILSDLNVAAAAVAAAERRRDAAIIAAHDAGMSARFIAGAVCLDRRTVGAVITAATADRTRARRRELRARS